MHKIAKNSTKKSGFTLIEIVLVMAILVILLSVVYATFYIINSSHARVAVMNDAKDYAYLNMAAIENLVTNANGIILTTTATKYPLAGEVGYTSLYFNNGALMSATSSTATAIVFTYPQYTVNTSGGVVSKWGIVSTYTRNADGTLKVKLEIMDNAVSPATVYYTLEKDLILLNIKDAAGIVNNASPSAANVIKFHNLPSF